MTALRSCAAVCLAAALVSSAPAARAPRAARSAGSPRFATLPMRFEPNLGQTDGRVRFTARTRDGALFLTDRGAVLRDRAGATVRVAPVGMREGSRAEGLEPLAGATSYFRGGDPKRWRAGVPGFARVRCAEVYPGVDVVYYGANGHLEYDFAVAAGADPGQVRLRVDGADGVEVDANGDIVLRAAAGEIRHRAPRAYQIAPGGRREVAARYTLEGAGEVAFSLGAYDPTLPLVIDPQVAFATYLGGADFDDAADVAVDASGAVYVVGSTTSTDFPTAGPIQGALGSPLTSDVFVAKLAADGGSLVYATYLGGGDADSGTAVAVDDTGAAYVAGLTLSTDFPTQAAMQSGARGQSDGFLTKLAPDGASLVFSTYFGGTGDDQFTDVRVRLDHAVVLGGRTDSADLPLAGASQGRFGATDGFVAVVGADGSQLVASTYLGGDGNEQVDSVVIGPDGAVFASGVSDSTDFAPCDGAVGPRPFLARVLPTPAHAEAVSCDAGLAISACVSSGEPLGYKARGGFEVRALAGGGSSSLDVRALALGPDLGVLREATFGGSGQDYPDAVAVGPGGALYVAGDTDSIDLPTVDPVQAAPGGDIDAFVAVLAPGSDDVIFATYLGGADTEFPSAIATDADGNLYVVGVTFSSDFPTSAGAFQPGFGGGSDAFVVKITAPVASSPDFSLALDPPTLTAARGQRGQIAVDIARADGFDGSITVAAPNTKAIKVKLTPASSSTTGGLITFNYKIKKKAAPGAYPLTFTGTDAAGRSRSATLVLTVQ